MDPAVPSNLVQDSQPARLDVALALAAAAVGASEFSQAVAGDDPGATVSLTSIRPILRALCQSGPCAAAAVVSLSDPPESAYEGSLTYSAALQAALNTASEEPQALLNGRNGAGSDCAGRGPAGLAGRSEARCAAPADEIVVERVPTRHALPALLACRVSPECPHDVARFAAAQIAVVLDREEWQRRAERLRVEADQRIRELSTIYEIGRAVDSVELDRLLELITEKAARLMGAQACSLMRVDPITNDLTIAASYGLSGDVVFVSHRAVGEGIAGLVAQTGEPLLIGDEADDPRLMGVALRPDIGTSMIVPMKDEMGRVIGVLSIRRSSPAPPFDDSDLRLFSVFASQASYALNNKQLYDDLDHRVRELSTLSELTQAVISNLDLTCLLEDVADSIVEVVRFDRCCIFLYDRQTRRFVPRIFRGYRPDGIGRNSVRMGEGVVGQVARRQMTIVENDGRNAMQPMRGFARALGTNAFLAVPIMSNPVISKGQTIGVVVADNKVSGRPFHPQSIELLTTFVTQAGIAIENAQLHEEWQQRYHDMNRLATQTENILRSIGLAVAVVDASGRVARWNRAAEQMWGLSEKHATSLDIGPLVERFGLPENEAALLVEMMAKVRATGQPEHEYQVTLHPRRRKEIVANVILSPVLDRQSERQGVILIVEDVTRQTRMEAEIGRIRRLADIGQLAAKMAHEVRNPLSSIKGAAQLMRNEYEDMAPVREFLDIIIDEVNHLSKITTDLLDFARPVQLELHATDLNVLAARTLEFLGTSLRDGKVRVNFRPDAAITPILCDPKQIEQVMRNVIINAVQAMPEGGELIVTTYANPDRPYVTVCFCDNGSGIAENRLEEIFQPFFTTKTKGTGLGLSIVRRIVESHSGSVDVVSRSGEGACFSVNLPRDPGAREHAPQIAGLTDGGVASQLPDV